MMIAQVLQQLFGPIFQGANGDSVSPLGGGQAGEFAGLMAEGDDSPSGTEGAIKGVADSPLPPIAMPDPVLTTPAVIAVQFNFPEAVQAAAQEIAPSVQSYDMPRPVAVQDGADESPIAANPSAAPVVTKAPPVLAADTKLDLVASAALPKVEGGHARAPLGQGIIEIDPSLVGLNPAEGLPDLAQKLPALDAPVRAQTAAKILGSAPLAIASADKVASETSPTSAASSGAVLDKPSGSIPPPSISITPSAAPNSVLQSLHPVAARPVAAGLGATDGASDPPLVEQPIARTNDGPAPRVTLRPVPPTANLALAMLQGIVQNADSQTDTDSMNVASAARAGDPLVSQPATAQLMAVVKGQGAVAAAVQTPAHMTAALVASAAGDAADLLGTAQDEDAPNSLFGFEARHGFAPSPSIGAAGAGSPVFAGAPATAAQLSAQLLPLAQSAQSGPVELVLSPAELGQLRFEIQHRGDQVQIVLSAERPETLDLLRRNSEQLLTDFRNAGFAGASLAFGGWAAGQNARGSPHEFDSEGQSDGSISAVPTPSSPPSQNAAFARAQSYLDPSRSLNLRL